MGCACCYAMFAVLLFILLYHGPRWIQADSFENYKKIYKSDDGWYVSIKKGGPKGMSETNLIMLMHNNWSTFEIMNNLFDSGDRLFMTVDASTLESFKLPDWDTFFITKSMSSPSKYNGIEDISWGPIIPGNLFGQRFLKTRFINNGSIMSMGFDSNGERMIFKDFYIDNVKSNMS